MRSARGGAGQTARKTNGVATPQFNIQVSTNNKFSYSPNSFVGEEECGVKHVIATINLNNLKRTSVSDLYHLIRICGSGSESSGSGSEYKQQPRVSL